MSSTDVDSLLITFRRGDCDFSSCSNYAEYLGDPNMSDVIVHVRDGDSTSFKQHLCQKVILAKQSTSFQQYFRSIRCFQVAELKLMHMTTKQFEQVLDFIYKGEVTLPQSEVKDLRENACKLGVALLLEEIDEYLLKERSQVNAKLLVEIKHEYPSEINEEVHDNKDGTGVISQIGTGINGYQDFPPNVMMTQEPLPVSSSLGSMQRLPYPSPIIAFMGPMSLASMLPQDNFASSSFSPTPSSQHPKPRRTFAKLGITYSQETLDCATENIRMRSETINSASKKYRVPKCAIVKRMGELGITCSYKKYTIRGNQMPSKDPNHLMRSQAGSRSVSNYCDPIDPTLAAVKRVPASTLPHQSVSQGVNTEASFPPGTTNNELWIY